MSNPGLAGAARERWRPRRSPADSAAALGVLIDLYAGETSRYLNFFGPARSVTTLPYDRVLSDDAVYRPSAGKAVFVGVAEPRQSEQQDSFISVFSQQTGNNLSGVEVGATAFANLLDDRSLTPLPMPLHWLLVLLLGGGLGAALVGLSTQRAALVTVSAARRLFRRRVRAVRTAGTVVAAGRAVAGAAAGGLHRRSSGVTTASSRCSASA